MSQSVPDFTTAIITILFLLVLAGVGFVIKVKSGSLKKIIKKQEYLEITSDKNIEKLEKQLLKIEETQWSKK